MEHGQQHFKRLMFSRFILEHNIIRTLRDGTFNCTIFMFLINVFEYTVFLLSFDVLFHSFFVK
jgi:hypothetical protein